MSPKYSKYPTNIKPLKGKNWIDVEDLISAISYEYYYQCELGIPTSSEPKNHVYTCPFHPDGKNPNLKIGRGGKYAGIFKCFSCGASGDFIAFHRLKYNFDFKEAIKDLARTYAPDLIQHPSKGGGAL